MRPLGGLQSADAMVARTQLQRGSVPDTDKVASMQLQEWSGARMEVESSAFGSHHHEGGEHKFNLLVKYIVRPSIAREFIGAFKKVGRRQHTDCCSVWGGRWTPLLFSWHLVGHHVEVEPPRGFTMLSL